MESYRPEVPTTKTDIKTLVRSSSKASRFIGLQSLTSNASTIFFGSDNLQAGVLEPGEAILLPETNLEKTFVQGTAPDILVISLFR